jgi:predicted metal-binding protein
MTKNLEPIDTPKWDAVMLICKQCGKRRDAPRDLKPKALVKLARQHLKEQRPRPRVVSTSCMGVCPKDEIAVAWVGRGRGPRIMCIGTRAAFAESLPRLLG